MKSTKQLDDLTIQDILLYSPYDNQYRLRTKLSPGDFKRIRIIPAIYLEEKVNLLNIINPASNYQKEFFILSGYSGNGKTTFLYWFKEEVEKEGYFFDIINLIDNGQGIQNDEGLLKNCLLDRFIQIELNLLTLKYIEGNQTFFLKFFEQDIISDLVKLSQKPSVDNFSLTLIAKKMDFSQLLIFFLFDQINSFITKPQFDDKKSFIFCFDNLDELNLEYLTPVMWKNILEISSKLNTILEVLKIDFEFTKKIKLILVFREAAIACSSAELNDRLMAKTEYKRFIYTNIGREIIKKRMDLVPKYKNDEDKQLRGLLEVICNDEYFTNDILLPLFNYDYRKLSQALLAMAQPVRINLTDDARILDLDFEEYANIPKDFIFGKRGILMNGFIRYFAEANYLDKLAPIRTLDTNASYCNPVRLILTVFTNLSFPYGFPNDKRELAEIMPHEFSLLDAYTPFKDLIPINQFFDILNSLININKSSWAHLITVYGKEPVRNISSFYFDFSEEINIINQYFSNGGKFAFGHSEAINRISLSLNASSYVYLRHILSHFEYISGYKTKTKSACANSLKPLFQLIGVEYCGENEMGNKLPVWQFELKIKNVFEHVKTYMKNNENYFNDTIKREFNWSKEDYCKSDYVFKGENKDNTIGMNHIMFSFYCTRMITTHIEYLENFRHYITSTGFQQIERKMDLGSIKQTITLNDRNKIHSFILEYIGKYIQLLKDFNDPSINNVPLLLEDALIQAKSDNSKWVRLIKNIPSA